ncbi:hypothetical protein Tco_1210817 [Tanacetum coccineum]
MNKTELTQVDFEGHAYEVVKSFYPDVIHLQFQMEECHKMLTDQVDWTNPEGDQVRFDVKRSLPLGSLPSHETIQTHLFFNKELEYLRYGSKGSSTALSISKIKAVGYPDFGLELLVPEQMWIKDEGTYDISSKYGISHCLISRYGYDYLSEIVLRRANFQEHAIAEKDFKNLYPSDFEDLNMLLLQGYLDHLPGTDNQEKDEKQSQNDKTGLGMEKTVKDKAKSKPETHLTLLLSQQLEEHFLDFVDRDLNYRVQVPSLNIVDRATMGAIARSTHRGIRGCDVIPGKSPKKTLMDKAWSSEILSKQANFLANNDKDDPPSPHFRYFNQVSTSTMKIPNDTNTSLCLCFYSFLYDRGSTGDMARKKDTPSGDALIMGFRASTRLHSIMPLILLGQDSFETQLPVLEMCTSSSTHIAVSSDVAWNSKTGSGIISRLKEPYPSFSPTRNPNPEPNVAPVVTPVPKASIPFPSRRNDEKRKEKANDQIEKFYEIFRDLSFEISFTDALMLMPKFASTLKTLIGNKEKLSELARTPLNGGNYLALPELTPTCMTLGESIDRSITEPIDPRVPLILGRCFLKTSHALIDVYGGEITLRVGKEAITFNLDQTSKYTADYDHMTANKIDVIEMACDE